MGIPAKRAAERQLTRSAAVRELRAYGGWGQVEDQVSQWVRPDTRVGVSFMWMELEHVARAHDVLTGAKGQSLRAPYHRSNDVIFMSVHRERPARIGRGDQFDAGEVRRPHEARYVLRQRATSPNWMPSLPRRTSF